MKPGFWSDVKVAKLPDPVRLFYIGLWNMADDSGWIAWDTAEAGALLYPFRVPDERELDIDGWLEALAAVERVVRYSCGCVVVPHLPEHQRISGVQSHRVRDQHEAAHAQATPMPRSTKHEPLSDSPGTVGKEVGNGKRKGSTRPFAPLPRAREAQAS